MDDSDAQRQSYWPELEELAKPAREHRRLSPERRGEIIISLCRRAPLSVKDLSVLLDRSEAYIGDAIRPLVNAGELTFLYPDQPRHPRQKYLAASEVTVDLSVVEEEMAIDVPSAYLAPRTPSQRRREDPPFRAPTADQLPSGPGTRQPEAPPRFPSPAVNLAYAVLFGVVLGWTNPALWWMIALVAAFLLSAWHRTANSVQYRRFDDLNAVPSPSAFMMLKSLITFAEIALVFLATRGILGS